MIIYPKDKIVNQKQKHNNNNNKFKNKIQYFNWINI